MAVESNWDFVVTNAIDFGLPSESVEGDQIQVSLDSSVSVSKIRWRVPGAPVSISDENEREATLQFQNSGVFTVLLEVDAKDGNSYSAERTIRVLDVPPQVDAGPDLVVTEGRFQLTRDVVVDPGDDRFKITVDYGDGSEPVSFGPSANRTLAMDHLYSTPGQYQVRIEVENDEGTSTDFFILTVNEAELVTSIERRPGSPREKGSVNEFRASLVDPSFQADAFTWSYRVDWGDGTTEAIPPDTIEFTDDAGQGRVASFNLSHVFEAEGGFPVQFTVTDDDGEEYSSSSVFLIQNDLPILTTDIPSSVEEDRDLLLSATATDLDGISSIIWDFGDGSPTESGEVVGHIYGTPGTYTVRVVAQDTTGGSTTVTEIIEVANRPEAPIVQAIPIQTIQEGTSWEYLPTFTDPDQGIGDEVTFAFASPASKDLGISIDKNSGRIRWTPSSKQGPARYELVIIVEKGSQETMVPLTIDVVDSGSISGVLFEDLSGNGMRSEDEPLLFNVPVTLDIGNDGVVDRTVLTDKSGRYEFVDLPHGLYRIQAGIDPAWENTTPTELVFDMAVSEAFVAPDLGGLADSDGDGVSNRDEIDQVPGGDGNGDGILDWQQSNVASLQLPGGLITIVSNQGTTLRGVGTAEPPAGTPDEAVSALGRIEFEVTNLPGRGRAQVELIFGENSGINAVFQVDEAAASDEMFRRLGEGNSESVTAQDGRLLIELVDGSEADLDAVADGVVSSSMQPAVVDAAWTNPMDPNDVDGDGDATAFDALLIINSLRRNGGTY
ncbi:MAG: PKD domain-containing protein, partial [Planctomycetota bacterium]